MRKSLLILWLLAVTLPRLVAESENAAILAAAESYLKSAATTEVKYIVEQVEGDLARVRINPAAKPNSSTAWIFLRKKDGKWTVISARASFTAKQYDELGIPKSMQIP